MPAPNPSNRERLLRLIDGGTEALKEMQSDEPAPKPVVPITQPETKKTIPPWATGQVALAKWTARLPVFSGTELIRLGKWLIVLAALIAALHYGSEMMKAMKQPVKTEAAPLAGPAVSEDESGVGLRLVGVDSSDAVPVALLEDLSTGKTYFARVNEKVKEVRVKQIQKNKVTVLYRGKNVELR